MIAELKMEKFTDLLDQYLDERDRQNSDYYDGKYLGARIMGQHEMATLRDMMNAMIHKVQND
jgi:hypothetical protein